MGFIYNILMGTLALYRADILLFLYVKNYYKSNKNRIMKTKPIKCETIYIQFFIMYSKDTFERGLGRR